MISSPASIVIADRVRQLTAKGHKITKLQTGEPPFDTPRYIIDGAYQAIFGGKIHYSNSTGLTALKQEISNWYKDEYNVLITPNQIILTEGINNSSMRPKL
jgi:aspartate/methionine/tyrosine aminotransferase